MPTMGRAPATTRHHTGIRIGAAAIALVLGACAQQPATTQAEDVHSLYYVILVLAALVFVGVEGSLLWAIVRYRRKRGDESEPPQRYGSTKVILLFFLIGTILVAALYPFGEVVLARVDANPEAAEEVDIQGSQWQWSAFYPNEGVVTAGKSFVRPLVIEVPIDEPIHIHLTSNDVMHEFFVPSFFFMRNALPGHPNDFTWTPTRLGTFNGQCAEFCGLGHYQMRFTVRVVTEEGFLAWVKKLRRSLLKINCPETSGNALEVTAHNIAWNTNCLHVPQGSVSLTVNNLDDGIDHNFAVWDGPDRRKQFFATGKFAGVATRTSTIPALPPGKYFFQCNVHGPAMSGVFIVGGSTQGGS
jgi:cytochrome c oxidase subunit 2